MNTSIKNIRYGYLHMNYIFTDRPKVYGILINERIVTAISDYQARNNKSKVFFFSHNSLKS